MVKKERLKGEKSREGAHKVSNSSEATLSQSALGIESLRSMEKASLLSFE